MFERGVILDTLKDVSNVVVISGVPLSFPLLPSPFPLIPRLQQGQW
jgi:hypothetical protein